MCSWGILSSRSRTYSDARCDSVPLVIESDKCGKRCCSVTFPLLDCPPSYRLPLCYNLDSLCPFRPNSLIPDRRRLSWTAGPLPPVRSPFTSRNLPSGLVAFRRTSSRGRCCLALARAPKNRFVLPYYSQVQISSTSL